MNMNLDANVGTIFYYHAPLAAYRLLQVNKELGERRQADRGPASIAFGEEVLPPPGQKNMPKDEFVALMEKRVKQEYEQLDNYHSSQ